jgi:hypothetical protein
MTGCFISPTESKPDKTSPQLTLSKSNISIEMGDSVPFPQCSASDDVDGNLLDKVNRSGDVNCCKPGKYLLNYSVSDKSGNNAVAICTVDVKVPSSAILYLPFDGDITDKSKNNLTSTNKGATLTTDVSGNSQSAFHFDGKSYIEFTYNQLFNVPQNFSISVWAKSDTLAFPDVGFIIDVGYVADRGIGLQYWKPGNKMSFYYNNYPTDVSSLPILDKLWHHYIGQYNGTNLVFYIDGTKIYDLKVSNGTIDQYPLRIGAQSKSLGRYWIGSIDEVLFMSSTLTDKQIKNLSARKPGQIITDTTHQDTTKADTTTNQSSVAGLKADITGSSGNLQLKLSWDAVSGADGYGIYYNEGATVSINDHYRIALNNYKTFTTELIEGNQYTFAVVYTKNNTDSKLSQALTITFKP